MKRLLIVAALTLALGCRHNDDGTSIMPPIEGAHGCDTKTVCYDAETGGRPKEFVLTERVIKKDRICFKHHICYYKCEVSE